MADGALDLEPAVSLLSYGWTVQRRNTPLSVFVRTFFALGTSTAKWARNEKSHSTNDSQRQNELST